MRRERFVEELEGYGKQLEEFQVHVLIESSEFTRKKETQANS
jgi:hypothetical protein